MPKPPARAEYYRGFEIRAEDLVVDVGCGGGEACAFAARLGAEVIGTDCDPIVIERLDARMRDLPARSYRGIVSDSDPLPIADASADAVICTEVLEHVPDPSRFLAELVRIGKPGARYLLSVPHPASEGVMRRVAPSWYWRSPYHQHVYEPARLDALIEDAGLRIEGRDEGGFYWSLWWIFRMALDPKPLEPDPDSGPVRHWERAWQALGEAPRGGEAAEALDRLVPKSQVRVARKPAVAGTSRLASRADWRAPRLKRWLRDGGVRVAGLDLRWQVRRAPTRSPRP